MQEAWRFLLSEVKLDVPLPHKESWKGCMISEDRYASFPSKKGRVGYVDGGSAVLVEASSFILQKVRLVGVVFDQGKRVVSKKEEFGVIVQLNEGSWKVLCFPENKFSNLRISLKESSLQEGALLVKCSKVAEIIRRLAELDFLNRFMQETTADVFVLDGSFEQATPTEESFLRGIQEQGKLCVGLSKTSRVLTKEGSDMAFAVGKRKEGTWLYHPVLETHEKWDVGFVRLHKEAKYVFRLDFWKGQEVEQAVSYLEGESKDPVFLGYPYGLIVADQLARVRNEERDFLLMQFKVEAKSKWEEVASHVRSMDAHSILDKIR